MIDTVHLQLLRGDVGINNFISHIEANVDGVLEYRSKGDELTQVIATIGPLKIYARPDNITVGYGSINKWLLGDNYKRIGRAEVEESITRLSDTLHLPMQKATVTRLDVGTVIVTRFKPQTYFPFLGSMAHYNRLQTGPSTLTYRGSNLEMLFYDKNKEQRDKSRQLPTLYGDVNALRFEVRALRHLNAIFKIDAVVARLLYNEKFYMKLLKWWRDSYMAIPKVNCMIPNIGALLTADSRNQLARCALVEKLGGEVSLLEFVTNQQQQGQIDRYKARDLKEWIKRAGQHANDLVVPSGEIVELDKKINQAIQYYR